MSRETPLGWACAAWLACCVLVTGGEPAAGAQKKAEPKPAVKELTFPPQLPGGKPFVTDSDPAFLKPPESLKSDVAIAQTPPVVDFLYFPGQDYPGNIWSVWGESLAANGKYYASIGDHLAPQGTGRVFEYDPMSRKLRQLSDTKSFLKMPAGHYSPGKVHSRLDLGSDGWLYYATHRGSGKSTTDEFHYQGDWILRTHPETAQTEVVVHAPVAKHCIPTSVMDGQRMIFYGSTAAGSGPELEHFFAYDVKAKKLLYSGPGGPSRAMMLARSTGKLYFTPGTAGIVSGTLMRFDPASGKPPQPLNATLGLRAASQETADGKIYAVSHTREAPGSTLYAFDTKTEQITTLGPAAVGSQEYVAALAVDATGRYLYYVPGAHGGSERDGTAIVQYDVQKKQRKVVAFLEPFYTQRHGCTLKGTYSVAIDPAGDKLYITWNASRGGKPVWDVCALTVLHLPESERKP